MDKYFYINDEGFIQHINSNLELINYGNDEYELNKKVIFNEKECKYKVKIRKTYIMNYIIAEDGVYNILFNNNEYILGIFINRTTKKKYLLNNIPQLYTVYQRYYLIPFQLNINTKQVNKFNHTYKFELFTLEELENDTLLNI